jgi:serine/threonine protein kinase
MSRHYLRINPDVKAFLARQLARDPLPELGWAEIIVADLTEDGSRLSVLPLPSNEHGPQLEIYGERFFAKTSPDKFRGDTLWVYRVEPGRDASQVPIKIQARFDVLSDERRQTLRDSVDPIFAHSANSAPQPEPERVLRLTPSPRLSKLLETLPGQVRSLWRPSSPSIPTAGDLLRTLRALWSRYRLGRFASPTPREEWMLRGALQAETLQESERAALLALIDIGTLNSVAGSPETTRESFEELLRRLFEIVPPGEVRAVLWGGMLAGASDAELREEVLSAAPGLRSVVERSCDEKAWTRATLEGLGAAAARTGDTAIAELLQAVEGDTHPLLGIVAWAERLEVGDAAASDELVARPAQDDSLRPAASPAEGTVLTAPSVETAPDGVRAGARSADWALAKCIPNSEEFEQELTAVKEAARALESSDRLRTPDEVVTALRHLESLADVSRRCLEQLPPRGQLAKELSHAIAVHDMARAVLGSDFDPSTEPFATLGVSDLEEVLNMLQGPLELDALPWWAWYPGGSAEPAPSEPLRRAALLCDPTTRRVARQLLALIGEYTEIPVSAISRIVPPPLNVASDDHVRLELEQLRLAARRLHRIPPEHREWVQLALARGDDEEETLQLLERLQALAARLGPDACTEVRDLVLAQEHASARERCLHQYERATQSIEGLMGSAHSVPFEQLVTAVGRLQESAPAATAPAQAFELTVEHNWVGPGRARAPLTFVPHEDRNRPYGFVSLPIALETQRRWDYSLRLDVRVRTKQRQGWLQDWDQPSPDVVSIGRQDWRRTAEGRFVYTFELRIPIKRPDRMNEAFEFTLATTDAITSRPIAADKQMRFESVELQFEPFAFEWPAGIRPDYVKAHPVGPQKRLAKIEARVKAGVSFAAVAPRRFGKTTLVQYLRTRAEELGLLCPEPIFCTSLVDERMAIDLPAVWRSVAESLQAALQCTVPAELRNDLPGPHTFDRARQAAANAGWKGILVLFDESQLLFPTSGGARIGDRLKDLLENHWSTTREGMAGLLFGFVGLPTLSGNVGVNFRNYLEPEEGWEMDEGDVNRIILAVTRTKLETTREARSHLAQVAPNLYLARILVESLCDRANALQRLWATYDDVAAVQAEIARQLEQGRQGNIASLVRDSLNDSADVNRWQPSPSYPVALALAAARHDGVRGAQPLAANARRLLNGWCEEQQLGSSRPSYREEDVKRHIDRLGELGMFDRHEFKSRFVEAWLVGENRQGFPPSAVNALVKGASTIVEVPDLLEPLEHKSGQARIYRFTRSGAPYALRRADLSNEVQRNRFLETVATLRTLSSTIPRGEAGIQYIFDLDAVGFSATDDMVGVHVYRWIEGQDLQTKVRQLPAHLVADIGMKLGIALQLLHRYKINHRDVRPKNIVLAHETKDPVLIDFGLARFDGGTSMTRLDDEFGAPEVNSTAPQWTSAADVYALGATLRALLKPGDATDSQLAELLDRMTAPSATDRPASSELPSAFDAIRARHLVDSTYRDVLTTIDVAVTRDAQSRWYPPVVEKFKPTFRMLVLGLHEDAFDRCAELADFLNQVLEAYPVRRGGTQLKLGYVKHRNDDTSDTFCLHSIDALHQLRISLSHGDQSKSKQQVMRRLSQPTDAEFYGWVREGAQVIADHLNIDSLPTVVEAVL